MKKLPEKTWCIVPAAGIGTRFGGNTPKQYALLDGKPVLQVTLETLLSLNFAAVIVALHGDDRHWENVPLFRDPRVETLPGGRERALSVLACLRHLERKANRDDWVLVHDVARPCVLPADICKLVAEVVASEVDGGLLAAPLTDTIKRTEAGLVQVTIERTCLFAALTPQMFRYRRLFLAIEAMVSDGRMPTDEAGAMEFAGARVAVVEGRRDNIKITQPEDLAIAGAIINFQRSSGERP